MAQTAKPKTAPVRLLYAVWDEGGTKHAAGQIVPLSLPLVKKLLAENKAERADPLPGEG